MVPLPRTFKEIDREMSRIMRNIRMKYKNEVKLQIINVKTMEEIKIHIFQQTYPFNRFIFLVKIPRNYPISPLVVEPIDISDEMRNNFKKEEFRFHRIKHLIEAILEFCNNYKEKQHRGSNIYFPGVGINVSQNVVNQLGPLISIRGAIRSPQPRVKSRLKLMKRYSDKIMCYSKSVRLDKLKRIIDVIALRRFKSNRKRFYFKPDALLKSLKDFYYNDNVQRRTSHHRNRINTQNVTFYCPEDYINCLELNSYLENTFEYVFLHKNVDVSAGNPDKIDLHSLLKHQFMMSSVVASPDIVPTRPMINNDYMNSFLYISEKLNCEFLFDDNVMELGENCHVFIKVTYQDLTIRLIRNHSIFSFEDVKVWPDFHWPCVKLQKLPLKNTTTDMEVQTLSTRFIERNSRAQLNLEIESYLVTLSVNQAILEIYKNATIKLDGNHLAYSCDLDAIIECRYKTVEDNLFFVYESDMEYSMRLNMSTIFSQPFEFDQINSYHITHVLFLGTTLFHQNRLCVKYLDFNTSIESAYSTLPLMKMYEICLRVIQRPVTHNANLLQEIDYTLELDLSNKEEFQILEFLNIPTAENDCQNWEFFIPKHTIFPDIVLIKDISNSVSWTKENSVAIHKVKYNSKLHTYFTQQWALRNYFSHINRRAYFSPICENLFSTLTNLFSFGTLCRMKSKMKDNEEFIKEYLNLPCISVQQTSFYRETHEFLENLSKSVN